jgi:hypothetical protein
MSIINKVIKSYVSFPSDIRDVCNHQCDDRALKIGFIAIKVFSALLLITSLTVITLGAIGLSVLAGSLTTPVLIGAIAMLVLGSTAILGASVMMAGLAQFKIEQLAWDEEIVEIG